MQSAECYYKEIILAFKTMHGNDLTLPLTKVKVDSRSRKNRLGYDGPGLYLFMIDRDGEVELDDHLESFRELTNGEATEMSLSPVYIGETIDMDRRYGEHRLDLANEDHRIFDLDEYDGDNLYFTFVRFDNKPAAKMVESFFLCMFDFAANKQENWAPRTALDDPNQGWSDIIGGNGLLVKNGYDDAGQHMDVVLQAWGQMND